MKKNLLIHSGANKVSRDFLAMTATPGATSGRTDVSRIREVSHNPIPHYFALEKTEQFLTNAGFEVVNEEHALAKQDDKNPMLYNRYFGLLQLRHAQFNNPQFDLVVGVRNSHDKSFPWGCVVGSSVFVCDNLAFVGEVKVLRRHTTNILRDLDGKIAVAIDNLNTLRHKQENRVEAYQQKQLNSMEFNDFVIRALDCGAITATQIPKVLTEWKEKEHKQFEDRNLWRAFNHITEVGKGVNVFEWPKRSQKLHGLCDAMTNMNTLDPIDVQFEVMA